MSEASGPGAAVQERREALGWTRQDVSDALNLSVRVVEAIESENWQQLPGPAFIRGYLRAYAKLLEIDGAALTSAFEANGGTAGVQALRSVGGAQTRRGVGDLLQRHPGAVLSGAVAVVICAVAVVLMAVWPQKSHAPAPAAAAPGASSSDAGIPRQAGIFASKPAGDATKSKTASGASAADGATSAGVGAVANPTAAAAQSSPVKDASGARRITPTGDDRLSFAFSDDCWVEIKDAKGTSLFSELGKSGATLELVGHPPFHITLGNAPAVTLLFDSERVTLAPHTRNNVGTLVLGQ